MRVGWLADDPGYVGGAELTAQEFRDAAPDHVEVVDCRPGEVVPGLDRYVIHNHMRYSAEDIRRCDGPRFRYHHDVRPQFVTEAAHIFCSPLQRRVKLGYEENGEPLVPPAIDLDRYESNGEREGAVWLGRFFAEKGMDLAAEWAKDNGGIDFYGDGPEPPPEKDYARVKGPLPYEQVPDVLAQYATFVHLPREIEPFGRSVVEAWASGCELVINKNVGATYWLNQPEKLETAAEDFWSVVLDA